MFLLSAATPWYEVGYGLLPLLGFALLVALWTLVFAGQLDLTLPCHLMRLIEWAIAGAYVLLVVSRTAARWDLPRESAWGPFLLVTFVLTPGLFAAVNLLAGVLLSLALHIGLRRCWGTGERAGDPAAERAVRRAVRRYAWLHRALLERRGRGEMAAAGAVRAAGPTLHELLARVCPTTDG